jgi:Tol biopolymer transport system component
VAYHGLVPDESSDSTDIYLYDTELENTPRRLTNQGDNWGAHWSPDGTRVAFSSIREGSQGTDLFVRNVNDDEPPRPLLTLPGGQWITDWPEDDLLVMESGAPSGIFLVDLSGDSAVVTQYYRPDADVDDMVVSPDGTLAAYASDESGQDEIYLRSFPQPRAETVVSEGGGRWPFWSPDGGTLYYLCQDNDALCAAEITTEPTAVVRSRRVVMEWPYDFGPDLHPDGKRMVVTRPAGTATDTGADEIAPERHIVVHNWFGELRRIFGEGG